MIRPKSRAPLTLDEATKKIMDKLIEKPRIFRIGKFGGLLSSAMTARNWDDACHRGVDRIVGVYDVRVSTHQIEADLQEVMS